VTRKMDTSGDEPVVVGDAEPIREKEKALLLNIEGVERWVPKSVIHDDSEVWEMGQKTGSLVVKRWFAAKNGWC
jgi:hypothetical protein